MPMIDSFFDDDYFIQHQDFSYEDPADMAQFGALMDKFWGQMYDLEGWSIVGVDAQKEYVRVTGRIKRHRLSPPPLDYRNMQRRNGKDTPVDRSAQHRREDPPLARPASAR